MKAISLTQPWATLVAIGAKKIETRTWTTPHRGPVAIHAAKTFPRGAMELSLTEPFRSVLRCAGISTPNDLPVGKIIAIANLTRVRSSEVLREFLETRLPTDTIDGIVPAEHELEFGDYSPRRRGFVFTDVQKLVQPYVCRGSLGLWEVPADLAEMLEPVGVR